MDIHEVISLIFAISFSILVIFLAVLVIYVCKTLIKINKTLKITNRQLQELGQEPKKFIHHMNQISEDILFKMRSLTPLFHSVEDVGEVIDHKTAKLRKKLDQEVEEKGNGSPYLQFLEMALLGLNFWKNMNKKG